MRLLADYVLKTSEEEIPVSVPETGDLRPGFGGRNHARRITMGFAAQDTARARRFVGREALLVTNIQIPTRELGRLKVLELHTPTSLLVAELLPAG